MIRCKEVATVLSTDQLAALSGRRRLGVRLHLMMCRHCRQFARQLAQLKTAATEMGAAFEREVRAGFVNDLYQSLRR